MSARGRRVGAEVPSGGAALLTLLAALGLPGEAAPARAECCLREVYAAPFTLPAQARQDWKRFFPSGISSPLHRKLAWSDCPPIEVWLTVKTADHDYRFVGAVTTQGRTQIDHEGNLRGTFTATVRLIDPDHGDAVLREAKPMSWTGTITDGLAHKVYTYEPSTDSLNVSWEDKTAELGKQFMDIDELIYDYERKPQSCNVALPEGSNDTVAAGETVAITLSEILDHEQRPTHRWQRVLVKVEKGTILNAEDKWGAFYVFRAGDGARAELQYRAPDDCSATTETLAVFNTCMKREGIAGDEKYQIATKSFEIACDQWELELAYHEEISHDSKEVKIDGDTTITREDHIVGALDYRITTVMKLAQWQPADALRPYQDLEQQVKQLLEQPRPTGAPTVGAADKDTIEHGERRVRERADHVVGPRGLRYYIALGVGVELADGFLRTKNMTIERPGFRLEENQRWSWHADKQGPIPLNVRLKTYANENSYRLALTDHEPMRMGDPAARHPFTVPWSASAQKTRNGQVELSCAGTAEVKSPLNFPAHVFGPVPKALLAYDGSQEVLRGEHSWVERTSELGVAHASIAGCKERLPLNEGGALLPEGSVRKTLTWTLRRLGGPRRP